MNLAELISTPVATQSETIDNKWGNAISAGFVAVPNALIKYQSKLGVSQNELTVLMNLLLHWWYKDRLPFPSTRNIAIRSGMEVRTVQRALSSLKTKQLIRKVKEGYKYVYDLDGLRVQLEMLSKNDPWNLPKRPKNVT